MLGAVVSIMAMLSSCASVNLVVSGVKYQSVRTSFAQPTEMPTEAKVISQYFFSPEGEVLVVVYNRTDEILTIDQTKSFLVDTDGTSLSYYDPTVRTQTSGTMSSETTGTSFNLGAISNAFGIGGFVGSLLGGVSVGDHVTTGSYSSSTVSVQDTPTVNVGPHGKMVMSKQFSISGLGNSYTGQFNYVDNKFKQSPLKFSVCISYRFEDNEETIKLVTDFYVNSSIYANVTKGQIANAFYSIYRDKPDAAAEYAYMFEIMNNLPTSSYLNFSDVYVGNNFSKYSHGSLIDYQ